MKLNEQKTALSLGVFFGVWHLMWSVLVTVGFAQTLLDWVFTWHMIVNPFTVAPFSLTNAVILVVVTAISGYVIGYLFAWIWNKVHEK